MQSNKIRKLAIFLPKRQKEKFAKYLENKYDLTLMSLNFYKSWKEKNLNVILTFVNKRFI